MSTMIRQASRATADVRVAAALVFLLGLSFVLVTGFSHAQAVHDAAHDTRHTLAFPCH